MKNFPPHVYMHFGKTLTGYSHAPTKFLKSKFEGMEDKKETEW